MLTEQFGERGRRAARLISAYELIPALALDDLAEVLDELPTHLVVGADGRMRPDPDTLRQLQERGVIVETLPTGQAVRRFGQLDPARAAAALHLTR